MPRRILSNALAVAMLMLASQLCIDSAKAGSALDAVPNCEDSEDKSRCLMARTGAIRFSPDGRFLLFSYRYVLSYTPVTPWLLARVDLSNMIPERIVEYPNCSTGFSQFDISSDGKRIAVQISKPDETEHVGVIDLDERKVTILASPDGKKNALGMPVFSKDEKKLFYYARYSAAKQINSVDLQTGEVLHIYPAEPAKCERTICGIRNGGTDLRGSWNHFVDPNTGAIILTIEYQRNPSILSVAEAKTGRSARELSKMSLVYQLDEAHALTFRDESFRLLMNPPEGEDRRSSFARVFVDESGDIYFTISPHFLAKSTILYKATVSGFEPFFTFTTRDNSSRPVAVDSFAISSDHKWVAYSYQEFADTKRSLSSFYNVTIANRETGEKKVLDLGSPAYRDLASTCEP